MSANYDNIARFYDLLSRLVYGRAIVNAQVSLLKFIPPDGRVLIVGGGTGWILEKIAEKYNSGITIDYVEASKAMIELSQKRHCGTNRVNFINLPIENFESAGSYDVIFTPFFFDNFEQNKIDWLFRRVGSMLKSKGDWLQADFVSSENEGKRWQKILLKVMYFFFRVTCNIETNRLVNMESYFNAGYDKISEVSFYSGFIKATAWNKRH